MIPSEEAVLGNFRIGFRYAVAPPIVDEKEYDVVARVDVEVRVYSEQPYRAGEDDPGFFEDFASDGGFKLFTSLDAPTREVPARPIGVAHEKYARSVIDDSGLDTERHVIGAPRNERPDALQHGDSLQP